METNDLTFGYVKKANIVFFRLILEWIISYSLPKLSFWEWCVLVKQWGNELRIHNQHEEGEDCNEDPEINEKVGSAPIDDLDDSGDER